MLPRTLSTLLLSVAAFGCDGAEVGGPASSSHGPDAEPANASRSEPAQPVAQPVAQRVAQRVAQPVAPAAERIVARTVQWPATSKVDLAVRALLRDTDLRAIERSGVPVLAPSDARLFGSSLVVATPQWFTIALKDEAYAAELEARRVGLAPTGEPGLSLFVQGTRLSHRVPGIPAVTGRDRVRGRAAWITQNESIWSATWEENGVTYVAEVECSQPADDRCASAAVLTELVEGLTFVGGAGPVAATSDRALPGAGR
jgi:hypothetical protein